MGVNVLAGLAEGVLDAILEREDDRERDPFVVALERYRTAGSPDEVAGGWRGSIRSAAAHRAATDVLKKLDRDLLAGIVRYASSEAAPDVEVEAAEDEGAGAPSQLGVLGAMPSLELGADGSWHVAAPAGGAQDRAADPRARFGGFTSRYPKHRALPGLPRPTTR
jgi:hypothetical protein